MVGPMGLWVVVQWSGTVVDPELRWAGKAGTQAGRQARKRVTIASISGGLYFRLITVPEIEAGE